MADVTLPLPVVLAAVSVTYAGLLGVVGWLVKDRASLRQEYRRALKQAREEKRETALTLRRARHIVELQDGLPSAAPPASVDDWHEDSAVTDAEVLQTARWLERRCEAFDPERTPEHVQPYRKKLPSRRG